MDKLIEYTILYVSSFSHIIAFLFAILNFKHTLSFSRVVVYYTAIALAFEILMWTTCHLSIENTNIITLYTPIEITTWILFFYYFFKHYNLSKNTILIFIPLSFLVCFLEYNLGDKTIRVSYTESFGALTISALGLYSFRFLILNNRDERLTNAPFFYFNCAVIIYFLGSLCFFASSNLIANTESQYWIASNIIHNILNIVLNILLSVGFWKTRKL